MIVQIRENLDQDFDFSRTLFRKMVLGNSKEPYTAIFLRGSFFHVQIFNFCASIENLQCCRLNIQEAI